jgi:diguanylate cyclase (GGDEF)-like protein/PAS domain S-box-containing protein
VKQIYTGSQGLADFLSQNALGLEQRETFESCQGLWQNAVGLSKQFSEVPRDLLMQVSSGVLEWTRKGAHGMSPRSASVLLVEANQSLADVLVYLLTQNGYEMTVEQNTQEAIARLIQRPFDLAIVDLQMPEFGGVELLRNIRRSDTLKHFPLVVIAAENQTAEIVEALSLGASDCVTVPLDFPVALARIKARLTPKLALEPLTSQEALLRYQLEASDEGSLLLSPQDDWSCFNQRFLEMWTVPEHLAREPKNRKGFGLILAQLKHPDQFVAIVSRLAGNMEEKSWDEITLSDGRTFDCYSTPIKNKEHDYVGRIWYFRDMTGAKWAEEAQLEAEEALRESEERYSLAAMGANDGLWDWDLRNNRIYYSPRWKAMLGHEEAEIGTSLEEWFKRVRPEDLGKVKKTLKSHLKGETSHFECEHRMLHKDGTHRWVLNRGMAVRDLQGKPTRMAGSQTDITQGKMADPLTGLPNRLLLMDRLNHMIEWSKRSKDYVFALFFLDLDRFRLVNDSLGHLAGDELLIGIARRIDACLRSTDTVARYSDRHVVAHLAGDEFTVLLDNIKHVDNAIRIAERIQKELTLPFDLSGNEIFMTASIGIAVSATGYDKPEDVVRDADTAMNRAKVQGKACYQIFDPAMHEKAVARMKMESILRKAIEREEFQNFYQPIVSLGTGRIVSFEALVRLQQADHTLTPADFIPVAEETGIILPLGLWVLREACRQMRTWQMQFPDRHPETISVNLSTKVIMQPDLLERIDDILRESGLEAQSLKLEITEDLIIDNVESAGTVLSQLKAKGIRLAIDDFGTGYSSLNYLHRFPIDTLKIDRSFISQMGPRGENSQIVRTIVTLARSLALDVVAEGVETAEQLAQLQAIGCEHGQGYFFSEPLDGQSCGKLITSLHRV